MKKLGLFCASLLVSMSVFAASNIEIESRDVADAIRASSSSLTYDQVSQISRHLSAIKGILRGEQPSPSRQRQGGEYNCVSRDNDGRDPWVLGYREGINVTRIVGETFTTLDSCNGSLNKLRQFRGTALLCASRDNDGRSPFVLASLNGKTLSRISATATDSAESCQQLLQSMRPYRDTVTYCASRDNDGRSPYRAYSLNLQTLQVQGGGDSFTAMEECNRFLGN